MKIAIVGSRRYENKRKIKEFIFKLKEEYGTDTIIVSGGCKDGADKYAKKYALELGLQYEEYPPFHEYIICFVQCHHQDTENHIV